MLGVVYPINKAVRQRYCSADPVGPVNKVMFRKPVPCDVSAYVLSGGACRMHYKRGCATAEQSVKQYLLNVGAADLVDTDYEIFWSLRGVTMFPL